MTMNLTKLITCSVLTALTQTALAFGPVSGLGGYMSAQSCLGNGGSAITGVVCQSKSVSSSSDSYSATLVASASYLDQNRNTVKVEFDVKFNDLNNYFNNLNSITITGTANVCGYHRFCSDSPVSVSLQMTRIQGQNSFQGNTSIQTTNSLGAEYVELTQFLTLVPQGSHEFLNFDLH